MEEANQHLSPIRFGVFEVDQLSGELRRQGYRVKLQEQPFRVLIMLLERAGQIVTREELQERLWPADTFVDFERGVNRAINKLREALGDDADSPRFIETVPRRGYRFLAPVARDTARNPRVVDISGLRVMGQDPSLLVEVEEDVPGVAPARRRIPAWIWASLLILVVGLGLWQLARMAKFTSNERPFLQFDLNLGPSDFSQPALSPNGLRMAFVTQSALFIRRFDQTDSARLPGTEGAALPFFSPDARWVGFFASGKLLKIAVEGGTPLVLCDAPDPGGGSWVDDNSIVAVLNASGEGVTGLAHVSASGGTPRALTNPKSDASGGLMHLWPQVLPESRGLLFTATDGSAHSSIRIATPDGKIKTLVENATSGRYLASGYLIYDQHSTLNAVQMDRKRLEITSSPVSLVSGVFSPGRFDQSEFAVSDSGTLLYRAGTKGGQLIMSWLYPSGKIDPLLPGSANFLTPRLSPDGRRVATAVIEEARQSLWVYDLSRDTRTRLTSEAAPELLPTWTPDGEFLAFRSGNTLAWAPSDGSGPVRHLKGAGANVGPWSFSSDGKWLAFWPLQPGSHLWAAAAKWNGGALDLGPPQLLMGGVGSEGAPAISPDGRWVAYSSDESGRFEVYVRSFSPLGGQGHGKWLMSSRGGLSPRWSRRTHQLFFESLDRHIEVASYTVQGDSFVAQKAHVWSQKVLGNTGIFQGYDVSPDGQRSLVLLDSNAAKPETRLHVMLHLDEELQRRLPAKR